MGRTCTVCRHANRDEIDRALVAGEPYRRIASHYGTNTGALQRHKGHIPATLTKARQAKETRHADNLWGRVERVMEKLETALNSTEVAKDIAALSRELLGALRMALEGRGELRQGAAVQVNVALATSPEWVSLQARIVAALGPFPDARKAVLAAIAGPDAPDHGLALPARSPAVLDAPAAAVVTSSGGDGDA